MSRVSSCFDWNQFRLSTVPDVPRLALSLRSINRHLIYLSSFACRCREDDSPADPTPSTQLCCTSLRGSCRRWSRFFGSIPLRREGCEVWPLTNHIIGLPFCQVGPKFLRPIRPAFSMWRFSGYDG